MEKIITGDWDGEPIWREETSAERLSNLIEKNMSNMKNELENRQEEFNDIELSYRKEKTLSEIKKEMEEIAGEWNGDEAGLQEDRANIAEDILEAVKNLEELMAELN